MPTIIFFGSSPLSNIVLQKLISAKCQVLSIVTKADKPVGRGQKLTPNPVKVLAEKNNIPVYTTPLPPPKLGGGGSQAEGGTVGLVAAYGKIIPQNVLDTFSGQIYNIHPSLLPKYRGASPLQQQILDGVTETGVTIIQLDAEMDHGPIVAQSKSKIADDDTWLTLGERLFSEGANLFLTSLLPFLSPESGERSGVRLTEQNHADATYTKKITRQDGFVEYNEFSNLLSTSPFALSTKFRAYAGWPGVWTLMPDGKRLKLISLNPQIMVQIEGKSPQLFTDNLSHR